MNPQEKHTLKLVFGLIFGGLLSVVAIILFNLHSYFLSIFCFIIVFFTWILDHEPTNTIISAIYFFGGILELFLLQKYFFGSVLIFMAWGAFFGHKILTQK